MVARRGSACWPAAMHALLAATKAFLDPIPAAAAFLADWPRAAPTRVAVPSTLPVLAWLADCAAHTAPATAPLMRALLATPNLSWRQTYGTADLPPAFLARYGWTELVGKRGPVPSEAIAAGFLLLGPHTHYPRHSHAAEELYIPLAGTAEWLRGEAPFAPVPPGVPIHHPSWMAHAMRTGAAPLLAFYLWRGGDLTQKSTFT